jgi:hypothetical protein
VNGGNGNPNPRQFDATELRRIAEAAHGQRNENLVLVLDGAGKPQVIRETAPNPTALLRIHTRKKVNRDTFRNITLDPDDFDGRPRGADDTPIPVHLAYDALFWSESAFEKFVLPYYCGVDPDQVGKLMERFKNPRVIAVAHIPPSETTLGNRSLELDSTGLVVLKTKEDGGFEWTPLTEFLR